MSSHTGLRIYFQVPYGAPLPYLDFVLVAVVAQPAGLEQPYELLIKGQVMDSVKAEMKPPELVKLNHDRRINFVLSDEDLLGLRTAGAQEGHSGIARHPAQPTEQCASTCIVPASLGW